jgi:hypothetical protein
MDNRLVLLLNNGRYAEWVIPALTGPADLTNIQGLPPVEPSLITSPTISQSIQSGSQVNPLMFTPPAFRSPRVVYLTTGPGGNLLHHFDLERGTPPADGEPTLHLDFRGEAPTVERPQCWLPVGQFCTDMFLQPWLRAQDSEIVLTISANIEDPEQHSNRIVRLWKSPTDRFFIDEYDYDPLSAQVLVLTVTHAHDSRRIHILGY